MTEKDLWEAFITSNNLEDCEYEAWAFGVEADLLAHLVAIGEKTATASAYPLYDLGNEPLPKQERIVLFWTLTTMVFALFKPKK